MQVKRESRNVIFVIFSVEKRKRLELGCRKVLRHGGEIAYFYFIVISMQYKHTM